MIDWLYGLQHFGIKLGLDNIRALLDLLDHPERAYPCVLVGGTNGKGSVAAMLQAMLSASGVPTGLLTSPHLVRPTERIRVGDEDIASEELDRLLAEMKVRIDESVADGRLACHPSFFEVVTATALQAFREHGMKAAVLEVGLGGRLDATNAVDDALSVIVSVDLDHVKSLGPTIEAIAFEKAGIVKPARTLVSGVVRQGALDVIRRTCLERGARFLDARVAVALERDEPGEIVLETRRGRYDSLDLALAGRHQIDNARVALAAYEEIAPECGIEPSAAAVREGLARVRWPGRLQWLRGVGEPDVLFDGAHNPAGARALAAHLEREARVPTVTVLGAMRGKLLAEMLAPLGPFLGRVIVTRPAVRRAAEPAEVAAEVRRFCPSVEIVEDPGDALTHARSIAGTGFVLVTGSLYLIGEILSGLQADAPGPVSM